MDISQVKVGESYKLLENETDCNAFNSSDKDRWEDYVIKINKVDDSGRLYYTIFQDGKQYGTCDGCLAARHLTQINNFKKIMGNVINKIKFAMKSEPAKSLIKAGIIDENETLTNDGKEILFLILKEKFEQELAEKAAIILAEEK